MSMALNSCCGSADRRRATSRIGVTAVLKSDPAIIRSLPGATDLVLEGAEMFWNKNKIRAQDQKKLFAKYNPVLGAKLTQARACGNRSLRQTELVERLELQKNQVRHYLNNIRPELRARKRAPVPLKSVYALLADFMPVMEAWPSSKEVARALKISPSTLRNYCRSGLIENKYFLKKYRASPQGVATLKELLNITDPAAREWKNTKELAGMLGVSKSAITLHCKQGDAGAKRYKRGWRIPLEGVNTLRNLIRKRQAPFDIGEKKYYPLAHVAEEAAKQRGLHDAGQQRKLLSRYYHLRAAFPDSVPALRKNKVYYVAEATKNLLMDLIKQVEACKLLGVYRSALAGHMRKGALDKITIGPTTWTTYSSVIKLKSGSYP
ncbi:MAG: hypothetical protein NTV49_02660 [Kiritimatiellaeota bacterium]|nr:hypothetical protein [Kiritimatiellota bacterium]